MEKNFKSPQKKACLNFPQNSYGESNCTQQVKTLENERPWGSMRRRVGMFFVFVWGLSLAEHIDFSRKDMCNTLTQCTGKAWLGRAGQGG